MKLRKLKTKKNVKPKTNLILFLLFCVFTLSLSVGYAALNEELNISGEATFRVEEDIRITNVSLSETTNMGIENYTNKYGKDSITLGVGLPNLESTVTYKVEIINSGTVSMWIDSITEELKNNSNMEYVLDGIGIKELINPGETKEFNLKVKYKEGVTLPSNTNLDAMLRFKFVKPVSILMNQSENDVTSTFYNGNIAKEKVEEITFLPTLEVAPNAIGYWDASENSDGTVIAWYTDNDNNNLYELNIGGIGEVYAPINSSKLFTHFSNVKSINFGKYFNTSNTTDIRAMFQLCSSLASLDLSNFDTSKITDYYLMFNGARNIKKIDISSFNSSNVTNFRAMFQNCSSLETVNFGNIDTSKVLDFRGMFYNCEKLTNIDLSNFNTSKVTNMEGMFYNCSSLSSLDLSNFDTGNVTTMNAMFQNCNSLINLKISNFDTRNVTTMTYMFQNCSGLRDLDVSKFNTSKVTTMTYMFQNCSSLLNIDISNWNPINLENMSYMFEGCSNLENINIANWNTSKLKLMNYVFANCTSLKNIVISNFNTSNVTSMSGLFVKCKSLIDLDLSSFNTSSVTGFHEMFNSCKSLKNINLSSFDTSKAENMEMMFLSCISLENLDVSNFVISESTNIGRMFLGMSGLKTLNISNLLINDLNLTAKSASFNGIPNIQVIYVKDLTAKETILKYYPDYNIEISGV